MNAVIHTGRAGIDGLQYTTRPELRPGKGEVTVRLIMAGLNRRDLYLMEQRTAKDSPWIPGSDGAGIVEAIGEGVTGITVGAEVIINPCIGWDKAEDVPTVPVILGGPSDGTFAETVVIPQRNAVPKPAYLTWEEAGVLSLSALTAYRALFTKGALRQGQHVLIPGIGGGVATSATLMAAAIGADVTVTSRSAEKRKRAIELSVAQALDSHGNWPEQLGAASVNLIIDSIGPAMFDKYRSVIKPGGNIVMFGATSGAELSILVRDIFYPQINLLGTSMGSGEEYAAMLQLFEHYKLRPVVDDVYPLSEIVAAFRRMQQGEQFGNIAIRLA